ncbi:hypothetical protein GpartN1_g3896.t1 [Galdieria partita]|uniref:Uncharacterized protein n=1 Tax=Galdieria partita TaxID=83374 RepID=A0A9C7PX72_9RHOD|nr:hypothetical protein GpartN1_g3896.t1 [Galdieria partita]
MSSSEHVIQNNCNILDMVSKKSPFRKRHEMFEQLVLVATAVEKDLFQFTSYALSMENPTACIQKSVQKEHYNMQMRNGAKGSSPILDVTHATIQRLDATNADTIHENQHNTVSKRKLKCKCNNHLKKTKIAPKRSPQSFVHVTKTVRVKCLTNSASKPPVRSIMKYRF